MADRVVGSKRRVKRTLRSVRRRKLGGVSFISHRRLITGRACYIFNCVEAVLDTLLRAMFPSYSVIYFKFLYMLKTCTPRTALSCFSFFASLKNDFF